VALFDAHSSLGGSIRMSIGFCKLQPNIHCENRVRMKSSSAQQLKLFFSFCEDSLCAACVLVLVTLLFGAVRSPSGAGFVLPWAWACLGQGTTNSEHRPLHLAKNAEFSSYCVVSSSSKSNQSKHLSPFALGGLRDLTRPDEGPSSRKLDLLPPATSKQLEAEANAPGHAARLRKRS
jgi:hypothetical protein